MGLDGEFVLYDIHKGRRETQPATASVHTSLVESRRRTMERAKRQDLVIPWEAADGATYCPFLLPLQAHGHCEPKTVSREKLWKLRLHGPLPPAATGVGCNIWLLILAVGQKTHCIQRWWAGRLSCQISLSNCGVQPETRDRRIGYRPRLPVTNSLGHVLQHKQFRSWLRFCS